METIHFHGHCSGDASLEVTMLAFSVVSGDRMLA